MGNLTKGYQKADAISKALPAVAKVLAEAEQWLSCRDQVELLTAAVESVLTQAERVLAQAHRDYWNKFENTLKQESVDLVIDAAIMLFGGRAPSRSKRTSKTPRLGKVLIAVGPEGVPEDLRVVNVSELAEREGRTDGEIERTFAGNGHVLFTIEEFKTLASRLKEEVLCGRAALPFHPVASSLITAGAFRLRSGC